MNTAQTLDRLLESYPVEEHAGARLRVANVLKGVVGQRLLESPDGNARYPATEILVVTSLIRKLLAEGKTADIEKAIEQGKYYGMHTFDQDILRLYQEQRISIEEATDAASNPDDLALKLKGFGSV
jgi:twitching motility protein PilT